MSTNPLPSALPPEDNTARPKFARRPASFSRPTPEAEDAAAPLPAITPAHAPSAARRAAAAPASTPWQEDARFGVVMLILVALVNLALIYGLPLLPHTVPPTNGPTEVAGKAPSMPDPIAGDSSSVTLYAQPAAERRTLQQLNLNHSANVGQPLTTSPDDTPPPTARALESEE